MSVKEALARYNKGAVVLHWAMAGAFFLMLSSGIAMTYFDLDQSLKFQMYQWHKSGGVLLLITFFLRVGWRFISRIPPLPSSFKAWEKKAAHAGHFGLYAFMIALPLSGWVMVSSSVYGLPTIVFDLFEWPHIPGIQGNEALNEISKQAHLIFAILFGVFIAAHIAAVVKHVMIDKENILPRMWFGQTKKNPEERN